MNGFRLVKRNPYHWDIYDENGIRIYGIRGEKNKIILLSVNKIENHYFYSIPACMMYLAEQLMKEKN